MFEIAGEKYYLDLNEMSSFIRFENSVVDTLLSVEEEKPNDEIEEIVDPTQMIDIAKWEMVRGLVETILQDNQSIIDNRLGIKGLNDELPIPFKISFNTLLKHGLIKTKNG
jgi:hypothetical protein